MRGNEGGDPSAVIFDAVQRAAARNADLVLADTAGRLHTKVNLMEELRKVRRVAEKENGRLTEMLLVLDAVSGPNGLAQATELPRARGGHAGGGTGDDGEMEAGECAVGEAPERAQPGGAL